MRSIYIPIPVSERLPDDDRKDVFCIGKNGKRYCGTLCKDESGNIVFDDHGFKLYNRIECWLDINRQLNNGWTKITSPDSLPKEPGLYKWYRKDTGTITEFWYDEASQIDKYTHFKPVVKELPPID